MLNRLIICKATPIRPGTFFILNLLCLYGSSNRRRRKTGPPCSIKGQNSNVNPFERIRFGFNFQQLFLDMINNAPDTGARPKCLTRKNFLPL